MVEHLASIALATQRHHGPSIFELVEFIAAVDASRETWLPIPQSTVRAPADVSPCHASKITRRQARYLNANSYPIDDRTAL
jgi:hypothetical protein